MDLKRLISEFEKRFGGSEEPIRAFMAPGRVNLIGEYTDFNGGQVFPCALDFGTYGISRKRQDGMIRLASVNFPTTIQIGAEDLVFQEEHDWCNYPKGVMKFMAEAGWPIGGMEILFEGNIPNGAGLSSSASIEVLTGVIIDGLFGDGKIDRVLLAKLCQKAENQFVGVNCGIMDQFAISAGAKGKTLLLKCDTLDYELGDFELGDYELVIINTNKRRALNESKYNERRAECEAALHDMAKADGRNYEYLCQISPEDFARLRGSITDEVAAKRAEHVIMENERVTKAAKALSQGDLIRFGALLRESHASLRDLFQVTGFELDTVVEEANRHKGCIGARMTGAGFGGCAIALVKGDEVEGFRKEVLAAYRERTGLTPDFYSTKAGNGAGELLL